MSNNSRKNKKRSNDIRYVVAVPFLSNDYLFSITRKIGWSIVDYLFLKELDNRDMTAHELSNFSNLESRVVIQTLLPMCKIGWIDIATSNENYVFRITELGRIAHSLSLSNHELPSKDRRYESRRDIFVDHLGNYYSTKDFSSPLVTQERYLSELNKSNDNLIALPIDLTKIYPDYEKMEDVVTYDGEKVDKIHDQAVYTLSSKKYLLLDMLYVEGHKEARVIDDSKIENLNNDLIKVIRNTLPQDHDGTVSSSTTVKINEETYEFKVAVDRQNVDFVYGGNDTKLHFLDLIESSVDFLVIHSTFIGKWCILNGNDYTEYFKEFRKALERGVQIYILWGKSNASEVDEDFDKSVNEDRHIEQHLREFNTICNNEGLLNIINYNDFRRTDSHSKFIITKHKNKGMCVMVSSCNFLFTQFHRFEASIIVYDERFTKHFIDIAANICCGKSNFSSNVRKELRNISDSIFLTDEETNIPNDKKLELSLVSKNQHQSYIDFAAKAGTRIYIISDYINTTPIRPIFDVLKNSKAFKYYYYCNNSSHILPSEVTEIREYLESIDSSFQLGSHHSNSHAKVLAWDNNHLLITSLNWLSGMTSEKPLETYHEIGVYITGWNVAKDFINVFREL